MEIRNENIREVGSCNYCDKGIVKGSTLLYPYDEVINVKGNQTNTRFCKDCFNKLLLEYGQRESMKHNNKIPMGEAEFSLLKMWKSSGIESVYKYKGRISEFRQGVSDISSIYDVSSILLYDLSGVMFANVEDIANGNHKNFRLEEFAVRIEDILMEQEQSA
ncbi:hypothetical protein ACOMH4_18480 [Bacillus sp. YIM B13449]|uniref:hypothetical protein n=1 Tax=Bacillus sp. YIM B13449 TaxID=3366882 RepID=UPI003B7DEA9A